MTRPSRRPLTANEGVPAGALFIGGIPVTINGAYVVIGVSS